VNVAQDLCERCPVRVDCLADALEDSELLGYWGGSSQRERRRMRRRVA
jgi:WhiB family redox-sensing transcriptional regulator